MSRGKCKLISHSDSVFLQQIYTGLVLLHKSGLVDLEPGLAKRGNEDKPLNHHHNLRVIVNRNITIHHDLTDGSAIDETHLDGVQYHFKRSMTLHTTI